MMQLLNRLNEFRLSGQFCDSKIKVCDSEFSAHKLVLAAFSPYFEAMCFGQFREAEESIIVLDSIEPEVMEVILDYAYSNSIDLGKVSIPALLRAADFLQVESLVNACCHYLQTNLKSENCISIWSLANVYRFRHPSLEDNAKCFALLHFPSVCLTSDFLELDADAVVDIIKEDSLNVEREQLVFDAVVRWFRHNEDRYSTVDKVLSHVRLTHLDPTYLHDWAERLNLFSSHACMKLCREVVEYHLLPSRRSDVSLSLRKHRDSYQTVEVMLVYGYTEDRKVLTCLNRNGKVVRSLSPSSIEFWKICASSYNDVILACFTKDIYRYNFGSDSWHKIAPNLVPRLSFGLCELDGLWFSIGGRSFGTNHDVSDVVEMYDPATKVWKQMSSMPVAVCCPAVVPHKGMIFALGGLRNDVSGSDCVQLYDHRANTWSLVSSLPSPIRFPAACVLDGNIHVFSTFNDELKNIHYIFEVERKLWKVQNDFPSEYILAEPVSMEGCVYVLTRPNNIDLEKRQSLLLPGESVETTDVKVLRYEPSIDAWVPVVNFPDFEPEFLAGPMTVNKA